ncbi:MAG: hypothetical protein IIA14_10200 [SAR324 cluster bacterium]|nr:hypothetical protein [SAR324 cluster bacterium]
MNDRLDPEQVQELMSRIKTEAVRIVEGHTGIVNQSVGDEVVVTASYCTTSYISPGGLSPPAGTIQGTTVSGAGDL